MIEVIKPFRHLGNISYSKVKNMLYAHIQELQVKMDKILPEDMIREVVNRGILSVYNQMYDTIKMSYRTQINCICEFATGRLRQCPLTDNGNNVYKFGERHFKPSLMPRASHIREIISVVIPNVGISTEMPYATLYNLSLDSNSMYAQSICHSYHNEVLYFYAGDKVLTAFDSVAFQSEGVEVHCIRRPVLDDMQQIYPESSYDYVTSSYWNPLNISPYSETYYKSIDLDNLYLRLLEITCKKDLYELLGEPVPESLDEAINNILSQIMGQKNIETTKSNS